MIITQMLSSDEIKIGSLQQRHDLTFVVDTMDAFIRFGELIDNVEVLNISSKMSVSVEERIDIV